jgi:hypothetical protein
MIDTVINYCTTDFRFIEENIKECLKFSNNVIIPVCDHFLDGTLENQELLEKTFKLQELSPKIQFILYEWNPEHNAKYHHNMSRWIGTRSVTSPYVLLADTDERIDGTAMKQYLETKAHESYDIVAFKCYWYFREPIYRAKTTEMASVLYSAKFCTEQLIFHQEERWSYRYFTGLNVKEHETFNGQIMCHHYSWVRSKEEMLKKVVSWAHSTDKNWVDLVNEEFTRPFNGTDFVHGYQYDTLPST